jgi:glutamine---fructose-6-phosphate transaminase (isomerizing)
LLLVQRIGIPKTIMVEKIQGTYLSDILEQTGALRDTVAELGCVSELESVRENLLAGRLRRAVLTGMGGSYQLLHPLHLHLTKYGFDSILAETSELLYSLPTLLDSRNVIIAVSQSGASAETVRLLERKGPLYIGVTNTPASPLATRSDVTVLTRAGEEGGVACKTSVTALAALYWVGQHFVEGDLEAARQVLETVVPAVEAYVSLWRDHVDVLAVLLAGARHVFLAGRGASLAAVGLGAMLQKEAAHFHAEGMSSAALRHGPFEMLGPDSFVLVFEGDDDVRELNHRLVRDVLATGARAAICGFSVSGGPFALPLVDHAMRPILELLPTQMMSLALAYLQGREPGKFERIAKVTTEE